MNYKSNNTFPDTYTNITLEILLTAFKEGPNRIRKSVEGMSEYDLKERVIDEKWSILEYETIDCTSLTLIGIHHSDC